MIGYIARGPVGTLFENVKVRIFAQRPVGLRAPDGHMVVVVQAFGHRGTVIAESPLCKEVMDPEALEGALRISRLEGWRIEVDERTTHLKEIIDRHKGGRTAFHKCKKPPLSDFQ